MMIQNDKLPHLNLGCGTRFETNWINIDMYPTDVSVHACDFTKGLPLGNKTMKLVYLSHVLEHIEHGHVDFILRECARVLDSKGVIRVVVPDLESIIRQYFCGLEGAVDGDKRAEMVYEIGRYYRCMVKWPVMWMMEVL